MTPDPASSCPGRCLITRCHVPTCCRVSIRRSARCRRRQTRSACAAAAKAGSRQDWRRSRTRSSMRSPSSASRISNCQPRPSASGTPSAPRAEMEPNSAKAAGHCEAGLRCLSRELDRASSVSIPGWPQATSPPGRPVGVGVFIGRRKREADAAAPVPLVLLCSESISDTRLVLS